MSKDQRLDLLMAKIKKGIKLSFKKFLEESVRNNDELVVMRNNKVVLVPARDIRDKRFTR
ncbi:MAG TPA: hypothetical protein VK154_00860 [Chitinophagales bacterium]|nr:hypothetical protein [Chitinophagales bacterium]